MKKISLQRHRRKKKLAFSRQFIKHSYKKLKKQHKIFWKKLKQKIERNRFLSNSYFTRIIIILFFLGVDIKLLPYFLETTRVKLPDEVMTTLDSIGVLDKDKYNFEYIPPAFRGDEPSLDPITILEKLNEERMVRKKEPFVYSARLAKVAEELLSEFEKYDFELGDRVFTNEFKAALDHAGYKYEHVSQNMVVGPLKEEGVVSAWFSNEQQLKALFDEDFTEVGFATKVIKTKYNETLGVTVQVLGKELAQKPASAVKLTKVKPTTKPNFPLISDKEVFDALNRYRESHGLYKLNLDDNLCKYAEKRLNDLIVLGSLDDHAGFKQDFADPDNLPQAIKDFAGEKIAENLAYQNCKNMTTGDGFIAETGTAVIEWCFDSSTAGHREAQLSTELNHACVRNKDGFFVVIFGQR